MGMWQINADTLAGSRFVVSPLAETISALNALERARPDHPGERTWLDAHLPAYRARQTADPVAALLVPAALGGSWNADFITPTPTGEGTPAFEEELAPVRSTTPERARSDLAVSLGGSPSPAPGPRRPGTARRRRPGLGLAAHRAAGLAAPPPDHRGGHRRADRAAEPGRLGGRPERSAPGDAVAGREPAPDQRARLPPKRLSGVRLLFVPVTQRSGWVSWDDGAQRYAVVYPCSGTLADADRTPVPDSLSRLLGPGRASVLVLLAGPKSTTHLVALTGQALGSVGRHLKILLDAGLADRRRSGRSVLYFRTDAGDVLVGAQGAGEQGATATMSTRRGGAPRAQPDRTEACSPTGQLPQLPELVHLQRGRPCQRPCHRGAR